METNCKKIYLKVINFLFLAFLSCRSVEERYINENSKDLNIVNTSRQNFSDPNKPGIFYRNPLVYNVDYSFELAPEPNKIDRNKDLKLWLPIPREWDSQKAVEILSVEPKPHARYTDPEHGNPMLFWDFSKEPEKPLYKVSIKFRLEQYETSVEIDPNQIGSYDKTSKKYALYTRSTHTINITPKIRELAQKAIGEEKNPYLQAKRILDFVHRHMVYEVLDFERGRGIQCLLDFPKTDEESGLVYYEGSCNQHSALFVALCRAVGIPARSVQGLVGWQPWATEDDLKLQMDYQTKLSSDGLSGAQSYGVLHHHVWAEFYLPGYGWIPVETLGSKIDGLNNFRVILGKGRDIKVGPNAPEGEGYGTRWVLLHNETMDFNHWGVYNIAKIHTAIARSLHHCYGPSETSLIRAAMEGILDEVKNQIEIGTNINARDEQGRTALHYAVGNGHKEIVMLLLANGADVNIGDKLMQTPIEHAIATRNNEIAELLISNGADVYPLYLAVSNGDLDKVTNLIANGADVNKRSQGGTTAINIAAADGFKDITEFLIAHGADINSKDNCSWTPLHGAAEEGYKDIIELLISKGANVNVRDGDGRTPLWYALDEGYTEIAEMLKKHGAKELP